ncbi:MAG: helix-turn-helix domain-containing protein [Deltaproteobacteria bacterium]
MNPRKLGIVGEKDIQVLLPSSVEDIIEKKLEDIATILCAAVKEKSRLHEEVMAMVERSLFRIALKRSNNVKSSAATYLGINRNTFQNKLVKMSIQCEASRQGK